MPYTNYALRALELFAEYGSQEAIVCGDLRLTYSELRERVLAMAAMLHEHRVGSTTAVALLVHNPPEGVALQLALHLLGCRTVWIAPNTPERQRSDFVRRAQVDVFIYDARNTAQAGIAQQVIEAFPGLGMFCLGKGGAGADLLAASAAVAPAVEAAEPQAVFQTNGTTGAPKLVHHRHSFFQTVLALSENYLASGEPRLRHLATSGFWHVSGQLAAMMTVFTGGTLVVVQDFTLAEVLSLVEKESITSVFFTPPVLYAMLDYPQLAATDTASLRMVSCGGAAAAPSRMAQAVERFGPVMRPVYGMSEVPFITALPNLTVDPAHPQRLKSCGQPYGDIRIEIRDDRRQALAPGEVGEVWVRGGLVMAGYWGQPALTDDTIVEGWLRTGDLGFVDEDGFLFLVDRRTDMIITGYGSTNVYSRPIEDALNAHPQVAAAAVIAVPDSAVGEAVHAYVVTAADATVTAEELQRLVVGRLNEKWAPREVEFVDALPLIGVGKVDKARLRADYAARSR